MINLTSKEEKELVKPFINDTPECVFANAMRLLEKQYGYPHKLLSSCRKEIKHMAISSLVMQDIEELPNKVPKFRVW